MLSAIISIIGKKSIKKDFIKKVLIYGINQENYFVVESSIYGFKTLSKKF
jgi:hypothetical protein